jgi:fructokinase
MAKRYRIGIDLGGTKIAGILLDPAGTAIGQNRIDAPRGSYSETIDAVTGLVETLKTDAAGRTSVGIGIPGSISPHTGCVQNANSTWLNGNPLKDDLEKALDRTVRVANDANCFALSEAVDGAGSSHSSVFGVIIGTGCGGGFVFERQIVNGPRSIGGEWGHNPLPWPEPEETPGPQCWCGQRGCMETWVSGPGMVADHARQYGVEQPAEEIAAAAASGCYKSLATLERHASRLARGLACVVNILDPGCIVLGGGLSNLKHLYDELPELTRRYIFSDNKNVVVAPPAHGAESGVRGAAWLWDGTE